MNRPSISNRGSPREVSTKNGLELRVDSDTTVSPALGYREHGVPVGRRPCGGRDLLGQRADLLDAEDVGSRPVQKVHEPAPHASANPIYVPAHDPHRFFLRHTSLCLLFIHPRAPNLISLRSVLPPLTLIAKSSKHENAKQPHWAQARSSCWGTRSPSCAKTRPF